MRRFDGDAVGAEWEQWDAVEAGPGKHTSLVTRFNVGCKNGRLDHQRPGLVSDPPLNLTVERLRLSVNIHSREKKNKKATRDDGCEISQGLICHCVQGKLEVCY